MVHAVVLMYPQAPRIAQMGADAFRLVNCYPVLRAQALMRFDESHEASDVRARVHEPYAYYA